MNKDSDLYDDIDLDENQVIDLDDADMYDDRSISQANNNGYRFGEKEYLKSQQAKNNGISNDYYKDRKEQLKKERDAARNVKMGNAQKIDKNGNLTNLNGFDRARGALRNAKANKDLVSNRISQAKANAYKATHPIQSMEDKLNPLNKLDNAKEKAKEKIKGKVKDKAKDVGKAIAKGIVKVVASNPITWIFGGILIIILMVPVFMSIFNTDSGSGSSGADVAKIKFIAGYEKCKSITVMGSGTYDLEDYVAGVVQHEAYQDDGNEEALKVQAIAARTFAIQHTNSCTTAIGNSQSSQTFSPNPSEKAKAAAQETAGQILVYDGQPFTVMYDSFCYADNDCPDATKNPDGSYTVTYTKLPGKEKHKITLNDPAQYGRIVPGGGHAYGMSQLVSYQMSKRGSSYEDIIKFFYSDSVDVASITAVETTDDGIQGQFANGFQIRDENSKPLWLQAPASKYYNTWINGNYYFQCVWYAKSRAYEIASTMSGVNESRRQDAINMILASNGNGADWYGNALNGGTLSKMPSSNNINKPRPGSIISWKWNDAGWAYYRSIGVCQENCGHVAIVEWVDEKNKKVRISEGWYECGSWSNYGCFGYQSAIYDYSDLQAFGGRYEFLGYVYVADYLKGKGGN